MKARHAFCLAAVAAVCTGLSACGTHHDGAPDKIKTEHAGASPTPTSHAAPLVIDLSHPGSSYRMVVGQRLTIRVGDHQQVTPGKPSCAAARSDTADAVIRPLCTPGADRVYQAMHPGRAHFGYQIRPNCSTGAVCPAWIRQADISIAVTGS